MNAPITTGPHAWSAPVGLEDIAPGPDAMVVTDPASGDVIACVPRLGAAETGAAIAAAQTAMADWAARPALERADVLLAWHAAILAETEALAQLITAECGKPLTEARGEVAYGVSYIRWFAEETRRSGGEIIPAPDRGRRMFALPRPVGVVAAITPWNFPVAMVTRKLAPALAAGCAVVLKPAPETPLSALRLAQLAREVGLPRGLVSVVTGEAVEIGGAMTADPRVAKLTFTGSTEVGRLLIAQSAPTVKRLSLELGGNAPVLVFDDADLDQAVDGVLAAKFRNAGQTCVCANRIYVQAGIHDAFAERLAARAADLRVGPGLEDSVEIGPLISENAIAKTKRHVEDALDGGGRLLAGGAPHPAGPQLWSPTVIANVAPDALCTREETFGPLAPIVPFDDEDVVIAWANASPFGLAAYLFTRDASRIWRVGEALEAGMVGVNTGLISAAEAPFGGIKQSGLGREGSRHGLTDYQDLKYFCLALD